MSAALTAAAAAAAAGSGGQGCRPLQFKFDPAAAAKAAPPLYERRRGAAGGGWWTTSMVPHWPGARHPGGANPCAPVRDSGAARVWH